MMSDKPVTPHSQSQENEPARFLQSVTITSLTASDTFASLNSKFSPDTVNPCPHCQQMALETAFQSPLVPGKQGYTLCHCRNPHCQMYGVTLNAEQYRKQAALED